MNNKIHFAFLALILFGVWGCRPAGPELGIVTGKILFDEKPLANVVVQFEPSRGRPAIAITNSDGEYRLDYTQNKSGATIGVHIVRITTHQALTKGLSPERIPAKYNKNSTLTADVKPGKNVFDFSLKSH